MKAIDIVLVPPPDVVEKLIEINRNSEQKFVMGKEDFVPHISLAIGLAEDLDEVYEVIKNIAVNVDEFKVKLNELHYVISSTDEKKSYALRAEVSDEIRKLHEEIMSKVHFSDQEVTKEMIFGDVDKISPTFNNFSKFAYKNFDPHITLLAHEVPEVDLPIEFTVSKIAVYHLGKSCTCRKLLFEVDLRK